LRAFRILTNELEQAAMEEAPDLVDRAQRIRGILNREGATLASLSGSGSSFSGLFDDGRKAQGAQSALMAAASSSCARGRCPWASIVGYGQGRWERGGRAVWGTSQGAGTMEITDVKVIPVEDEKL